MHDLSKYSLTEIIPSIKYWTGDRSPIDNQIEDIGYSEAWLHHKGRNKHHFEYWIDQSHGDPQILCDMPLRYIAEMFCDRVGASKAYLGDKYTDRSPLEYAEKKTSREEKLMSPRTREIIMKWLSDLAEHGEEYVCKEIRAALKEK